jgi:hypothetical protein
MNQAAAFIIDRDVLTPPSDSGRMTDEGRIFGQNLQAGVQLRSNPHVGRPFRLYDDDGELYYEGRIIVGPVDEAGTELDFMPLDWAMSNAGCTRIDYRNAAGQWEML